MVFGKNRSYYYKGEMKDLIAIVEKTIYKTNLTIKNKSFHRNFFKYNVSEKMQFITFFWPLHFEIIANEFEKFILLEIRAWSTTLSPFQDVHIDSKLNEFMSSINGLSNSSKKAIQPINNSVQPSVKPTVRSTIAKSYEPVVIKDDLKTLKMRYKNGEITREEYKKLRRK